MVKKILVAFVSMTILSTAAVLANSVTIGHNANAQSQYGWGSSDDGYCGVGCMTISTSYTLGNARAKGAAYIYDSTGYAWRQKSATEINEPVTCTVNTTVAHEQAYHTHRIADYILTH